MDQSNQQEIYQQEQKVQKIQGLIQQKRLKLNNSQSADIYQNQMQLIANLEAGLQNEQQKLDQMKRQFTQQMAPQYERNGHYNQGLASSTASSATQQPTPAPYQPPNFTQVNQSVQGSQAQSTLLNYHPAQQVAAYNTTVNQMNQGVGGQSYGGATGNFHQPTYDAQGHIANQSINQSSYHQQPQTKSHLTHHGQANGYASQQNWPAHGQTGGNDQSKLGNQQPDNQRLDYQMPPMTRHQSDQQRYQMHPQQQMMPPQKQPMPQHVNQMNPSGPQQQQMPQMNPNGPQAPSVYTNNSSNGYSTYTSPDLYQYTAQSPYQGNSGMSSMTGYNSGYNQPQPQQQGVPIKPYIPMPQEWWRQYEVKSNPSSPEYDPVFVAQYREQYLSYQQQLKMQTQKSQQNDLF